MDLRERLAAAYGRARGRVKATLRQAARSAMGAALGLVLSLGITAPVLASSLYEVECWTPQAGMRDTVVALKAQAREAERAGDRQAAGILQARAMDLCELAWRDVSRNLVVNTGLNDLLDKYFKGSTYTAAHYVGLTDGSPTIAAGDTMASHVGWAEVAAYSEGTREALTPGTVASQSVDNSASKASFSISSTVTIGGAFVTTDSTKSGSTGTLYGAAAFTGGDRSVGSGDTVNVTITATAAAA